MIKEVTDFLSNNFKMKDMGVADVIFNTMLLIYNGGATLAIPLHGKGIEPLWVE